MPGTDSAAQLAAIYSAANAFFNPTVEDDYPTVNLEAEACDTLVVTYSTGGCAETLALNCSRAVQDYNDAIDALKDVALEESIQMENDV